MKKTYIKPQIMFEDFALSTNIAASCEAKTNTPSSTDGCGYQPEGLLYSIFTEEMNGCERKYADGYNGICYHVPLESNTVFNS